MITFRSFLEDLQSHDELKTIEEEIHWDLQCSALCAMSQRVGGPAIKFSNIKGHSGIPLAGSIFCGPGFLQWPQQSRRMQGRIAIALGLDPETHYDEVVETILERKKTPIKAMGLSGGPCQEVVFEDKDVDLYQYPIPFIHNGDGGRYINSAVVITKDPEVAWTDFDIYRLMLIGRNKLVHGPVPRLITSKPIEQMIEKYHRKGQALPFAIILGAPPSMSMASYFERTASMDEYALAGGLGLSPLTLIKAKLSDLLIPADAEVVLEGHIYPGEMAEEGPYASISFYTSRTKSFVYRVELITQRKDPVISFIAEGAKPSDSMCLFSIFHSVELLDHLRSIGIPTKWVTIPVETKLCLGVVSIQAQPLPGLPSRAASAVFSKSPFIRQIIFVDRDVDSEDLITPLTDKTYKANTIRNYHISPRAEKTLGLTENHDFQSGLTSTVYIDATWRLDRPPETIPRRVSYEVCFPPEIQEKVIKIWDEELKISPKAVKFNI